MASSRTSWLAVNRIVSLEGSASNRATIAWFCALTRNACVSFAAMFATSAPASLIVSITTSPPFGSSSCVMNCSISGSTDCGAFTITCLPEATALTRVPTGMPRRRLPLEPPLVNIDCTACATSRGWAYFKVKNCCSGACAPTFSSICSANRSIRSSARWSARTISEFVTGSACTIGSLGARRRPVLMNACTWFATCAASACCSGRIRTSSIGAATSIDLTSASISSSAGATACTKIVSFSACTSTAVGRNGGRS